MPALQVVAKSEAAAEVWIERPARRSCQVMVDDEIDEIQSVHLALRERAAGERQRF